MKKWFDLEPPSFWNGWPKILPILPTHENGGNTAELHFSHLQTQWRHVMVTPIPQDHHVFSTMTPGKWLVSHCFSHEKNMELCWVIGLPPHLSWYFMVFSMENSRKIHHPAMGVPQFSELLGKAQDCVEGFHNYQDSSLWRLGQNMSKRSTPLDDLWWVYAKNDIL